MELLEISDNWNKPEWVNPRSRDERKNPFFVSSKIDIFKDNVKTAHWVGHSQLRYLDTDDLFKKIPLLKMKNGLV